MTDSIVLIDNRKLNENYADSESIKLGIDLLSLKITGRIVRKGFLSTFVMIISRFKEAR